MQCCRSCVEAVGRNLQAILNTLAGNIDDDEDDSGEVIPNNLRTVITLIPIFDLMSDYWLIITERSWESGDELELYAFYLFCASQFLMIWGSNAWWTLVHFKDPLVKVDCKLPLKLVLIIIPWAWLYNLVYPWVRYPIMMPAMLFMAVGWWQETNDYWNFMFFYLYPNKYFRTFVLHSDTNSWSNKKVSGFTAAVRYFTTFGAGMRGLIDMASNEHVEKLLEKNYAHRRYTRLLSIGALIEELTENLGGIIISVLAIMRDEPSTAAYTSLAMTLMSFLIETGRMLGKIYLQYDHKPCTKCGALLVRLYRTFQCLCSCVYRSKYCACCDISGDISEENLQCCLCSVEGSVEDDDVEGN